MTMPRIRTNFRIKTNKQIINDNYDNTKWSVNRAIDRSINESFTNSINRDRSINQRAESNSRARTLTLRDFGDNSLEPLFVEAYSCIRTFQKNINQNNFLIERELQRPSSFSGAAAESFRERGPKDFESSACCWNRHVKILDCRYGLFYPREIPQKNTSKKFPAISQKNISKKYSKEGRKAKPAPHSVRKTWLITTPQDYSGL